LPDVGLINDLEAIAHGLDELEDKDVAVLHPSSAGVEGNRAIIAAGTGLARPAPTGMDACTTRSLVREVMPTSHRGRRSR
jgi:glucokinase